VTTVIGVVLLAVPFSVGQYLSQNCSSFSFVYASFLHWIDSIGSPSRLCVASMTYCALMSLIALTIGSPSRLFLLLSLSSVPLPLVNVLVYYLNTNLKELAFAVCTLAAFVILSSRVLSFCHGWRRNWVAWACVVGWWFFMCDAPVASFTDGIALLMPCLSLFATYLQPAIVPPWNWIGVPVRQ
jgi:hypothetical protein